MSFWAFIVPYYEARLQHYESLDLGRCGECELLAAAREASALRKFLTDLVEEGYTDTEALLRDRADAADRLQRFLSAALETLGPAAGTRTVLPGPGTGSHSVSVRRQGFFRRDKPARLPLLPVQPGSACRKLCRLDSSTLGYRK